MCFNLLYMLCLLIQRTDYNDGVVGISSSARVNVVAARSILVYVVFMFRMCV